MPRTRLTNLPRSRVIQRKATVSRASSSSFSEVALHADAPPPPDEVIRHTKRRIRKSERDEHKDILRTLREVRTYRGGFTRPTIIRATNWFKGGPYVVKRKVYESPEPAAYTPYTVFYLEGRYPVSFGLGRTSSYPAAIAKCKEGYFPSLVRAANSLHAKGHYVEAMDTARWPWEGPRKRKRVKWWERGENPRTLPAQALDAALSQLSEESQSEEAHQASSSKAKAGQVPTELLAGSTSFARAVHPRGFHTAVVARNSDDHSSHQSRKNIPTSSWSRSHRPSQDASDDVVPTYYVERKKQRDQIAERKEEEGGLMAELNAGILSEGLAAQTRVREEKIPVEVRLPDGRVAHPSGFTPPTPETEFHPVAAKIPTEEHPLVATVKQTWDEREFPIKPAAPIIPDPEKEQGWVKRVVTSGGTGKALTGVRDINAEKSAFGVAQSASTSTEDRSKIATSAWDSPTHAQDGNDPDSVVPSFYIERKKQRDQIAERKEEEGGLMAELNAGILNEDLAAQTREREEKIPVEVPLEDGTVVHPSGFQPPTPETKFHPVAAKPPDSPKLPWTEVAAVKEGSAAPHANSSAKKSNDARGLHTSAVVRAAVLPHSPTALQLVLDQQGIQLESKEVDPVFKRRERYFPFIEKQPYWRPLLSVTLSTRPLADAMCENTHCGDDRGHPYYVSLNAEDRKDFSSMNTRMRNLRLNRFQDVTKQIALRLHGRYGGFLGIRAKASDRGRGYDGEHLADGLPKETRMIKIGVGEWYPFAEEVKERFLADAEAGGYRDSIEVFGIDEWGMRTDGKRWNNQQEVEGAVMASLLEEQAEPDFDESDVD
ncbi:hypothetical protein BN946_scf184998.g55 [Trametes cinnabarina]|uniref:Uncharacterized protein n=1 Tax=Pycnoporus cinnabarinus TaxID=5643 RepID=A0A060S843_PYCCI|nr:hypothetical protein BN946_scf184998.g55 [Trametes cinnabarina]